MLTTPRQHLIAFVFALILASISAALPASETDSVDFIQIQKQAGFASAAYQPEDKIRAFLESQDYLLTLYQTDPEIQVAFFLATDRQTKTQVVSVRGTSNVENAMVDIALKLKVDQDTGIKLHQGFARAAKQVYAELKPLLEVDHKIYTTGHSLGGAVALILAMYLDSDGYKIEQVITFGQPKVTNIAGASKTGHIDIIRVVTALDIVPLVPPFDPLDINSLDVYWHVGKEVILLTDNQYAILQGVDSMLRATRFTQQPFNQNNIQNHSMSVYLGMLGAQTKDFRQVPYKVDLNLFNLFGGE